ncbi:hypothetical protein GCM10018783_57780 [Streptomyces griseosporeus]|nr:hypothetical protein GCM10018783_57780 [Streptomyces griseosporeus]
MTSSPPVTPQPPSTAVSPMTAPTATAPVPNLCARRSRCTVPFPNPHRPATDRSPPVSEYRIMVYTMQVD